MHEKPLKCELCHENITCAPQHTYGPRRQYYKPILPIVTLYSSTKDGQESAQARGATLFHNATCYKGRSSTIINTRGFRRTYKELNNDICAIRQLHFESFPGERPGWGVTGGNRVGFNNKQDHEWNEHEW